MSTQGKLMGSKSDQLRNKDDFYPTPDWVIDILLDNHTFEGDIWECACGDGAISEALLDRGYNVKSTDLVFRGYGKGRVDFLMEHEPYENIVTNPPFNLSYEFMEHCAQLYTRSFALLLPIRYLTGKKRCNFYKQNPPSKIIIIPTKVDFMDIGNPMMEFAWFIWEKGKNETKVIFI